MTPRAMTVLSASFLLSTVIVTPSFASMQLNRAAPGTEAYSFIDQNGAQQVIRWDGHVVGADPDANVRFQLMRDGYADEN